VVAAAASAAIIGSIPLMVYPRRPSAAPPAAPYIGLNPAI
jgi:hypothetical protein